MSGFACIWFTKVLVLKVVLSHSRGCMHMVYNGLQYRFLGSVAKIRVNPCDCVLCLLGVNMGIC